MDAGVESTCGKGDAPGFAINSKPSMKKDDREFWKFEPPCNSTRMIATSMHCLLSWQANCKVDLMIYDCNHLQPDPMGIAHVTDCIVSCCCKGCMTLVEEKQ